MPNEFRLQKNQYGALALIPKGELDRESILENGVISWKCESCGKEVESNISDSVVSYDGCMDTYYMRLLCPSCKKSDVIFLCWSGTAVEEAIVSVLN